MTTLTTRPTGRTRSDRGSAVGRVLSLTRMELTLLGRNRTALFNAVATAPFMVFLLLGVVDSLVGDGGRGEFAGMVVAMLVAFALLFVVYYNLTTTAVARREELMLKRLTTGESTRGEVLLGMSAPAVVVVLGQLVLGFCAAALAFGMPSLVNPVLVLLAVVLGFAAFALLGYASSGLTRSVESAQLTTLPLLGVAMLFSGLTLPMDVLPDAAQDVARLTPLAPVVTLLRLGLNGVTADGERLTLASSFVEGLAPVGVLVAWIVIGAVCTQRWMRWEPRR